MKKIQVMHVNEPEVWIPVNTKKWTQLPELQTPNNTPLRMNCIYCKKEIVGDYWQHESCKIMHDEAIDKATKEAEENPEYFDDNFDFEQPHDCKGEKCTDVSHKQI